MSDQIKIRNARSTDWSRIRDICCLTGKAGLSIDRDRWDFFGELWIGPYQRLEQDWCFVAVKNRTVVGYLTGCPNTELHEKKKLVLHSLPLLATIWKYRRNNDVMRFIKQLLRIEKGPNESFSKRTLNSLQKKYPAHLHVNLVKEARGQNIGDQLIAALETNLKLAEVPGVHVFCGSGPLKFYERMGFKELEKIEYKKDVWVYCLGKKLD